MSLSPTDILQRLKELKLWQESHEELLKKTKNVANTSANVTTASDYHTIEGLSAFDSTMNNETSPETKNLEAKVISPTKSFNELLEEKLAQDPGPENVPSKPKRPFLRKGTGLERFKLRPRQKPLRANKSRSKSESGVTPLRAPDLSIKPRASWSQIEDAQSHVRRINSIAQMEKSQPGEQTLYEKQLEKELRIFEALEERAENSSFCSTNSSVVRILSSTPSKIPPPITEEKRVHWESQSEDEEVIETDLGKEDIAQILLRLKTLAENNIKPNIPSIIDASDDEKWSTTEPSSSNTSITSTDLESTLKTEKRDIGVGTNELSSGNCVICGDKLQEKITEYEEKIKEVIQDKNRISEHKKQLEQKEREFFKKRREFEDEKQDIIFDLESEKKKLIKEKQVFQMYMKDSQNRPNKKERQELSNLKQEVADLTETLKLKESKNGMTQARLRNQVKQLEKENSNLKDEIEKLTKENAKLSASQKLNRKSSDSKILHEINKNISKLAQDSSKTKKPEQDVSKRKKSVPDQDNNSFLEMTKIQHKQSHLELDKEDSLLDMELNQNHVDLETQYENTFRNQSVREISRTIDNVLEDGSKQIKLPNSVIKTVSPDGNFITIKYFNGDKQETNLLDGTIKYYFFDKNICQTTYADGMEEIEYPQGITEKRYPGGKSELTLPDGVIQITFPDGSQETRYTDGSVVQINKSGIKTLLLPNGQKEIETNEYKRREYPDGTIKILYPDGTQETKYANGRVRIKDGNGTLIVDTQS